MSVVQYVSQIVVEPPIEAVGSAISSTVIIPFIKALQFGSAIKEDST